jgi:hypothetical protein
MGFHPGREDRIYHVHKHFLDPRNVEAWAWAEPRVKPCPAHFTHRMAQATQRLEPWHWAPLRREWWRGQPVLIAQEAHDEGYAPRYMHLVRLAGPLEAGSKWIEQPEHGPDRWRAEVLGYRVAVAHDPLDGRCRVVTAYTTPAVDHEAQATAAMSPFVEMLEDCLASPLTRVPPSSPPPSGDRSRS